uniref:Palmitoyltransferase n=1 Tax=Chromera velia CCMP2878 TaxID=1169474 RepID=A0A0G4HVC6_9ALVE|eukprot:Cvel_8830.t1-p1 / transcript=Cvel_8830.t1 / gene=Cvel_8830 / organism=Chromera_velia_CCMP2878 / gene_product=Probable S-acyltransferase At3g09320, putative / transcript_product=Probable S-acyltransferase At3g09320, putative / location=Cvel_scaffold495:31028-33697(+) / protein_length=399 / sequence_SO=supercontig / SO=protein_coding / is_pseudo=false
MHPGSLKGEREFETSKFLPVLFIMLIIGTLYSVYTVFHLFPLLHAPATNSVGTVQITIFNVLTAMVLLCYFRAILQTPGGIPDTLEWRLTEGDTQKAPESFNLQELKRTGERRRCKWCAKYKPDRCHHCRVCGTCVLKMDHHCPWIYNCVGYANHKFFFLLLLYSTITCHFIWFTMFDSVKQAVDEDAPFGKMFLLLFTELLSSFLGVVMTAFWIFHIWLALRGMTTIEFCEKSFRKSGFNTSVYDVGFYGNVTEVLGENPALWLLPFGNRPGTGLSYLSENSSLLDVEAGRRRKKSRKKERQKEKERGEEEREKGKEAPLLGSASDQANGPYGAAASSSLTENLGGTQKETLVGGGGVGKAQGGEIETEVIAELSGEAGGGTSVPSAEGGGTAVGGGA